MLSKEKIGDQLKKLGFDEPKFYYRTKTIFNEKLTTVYLIFISNSVILAITDPRKVQRENLEFIECIPFFEIVFYKEDNMYLVMKWMHKHLLIGFKDHDVLQKFCNKISTIGISFGKKTKKRVLGNDDGESVSYKLDNESIDHISTDTRYDVCSFDNGSEINNTYESITNSLKSFSENNSITSTKEPVISDTSQNKGKPRTKPNDTKKKSEKDVILKCENKKKSRNEKKNVFSSKLSEDLSRRSENKLVNSNKNREIYNTPGHSNSNTGLFSRPYITRSEKTSPKKQPQEIDETPPQNANKIKAHIEFGNLNFLIVSDATFQALCNGITLRICKHFDKSAEKPPNYNISLLEHFKIFVRQNQKLFRLDSEADFCAATYENENKLDIVVENTD